MPPMSSVKFSVVFSPVYYTIPRPSVKCFTLSLKCARGTVNGTGAFFMFFQIITFYNFIYIPLFSIILLLYLKTITIYI